MSVHPRDSRWKVASAETLEELELDYAQSFARWLAEALSKETKTAWKYKTTPGERNANLVFSTVSAEGQPVKMPGTLGFVTGGISIYLKDPWRGEVKFDAGRKEPSSKVADRVAEALREGAPWPPT